MGCVDVDNDGKLEVVGLEYTQNGQRVEWARTVVRLRGAQARNGEVHRGRYVAPQDPEKIRLLSAITCGDRDMGRQEGVPTLGDGQGAAG